MSERAKVLKVVAIISSTMTILSLMFIVIVSYIVDVGIYPYAGILLAILSCIFLWKQYIDEKKRNRKSV